MVAPLVHPRIGALSTRRTQNALLIILLAGFWIRVHGALEYPFVFDEVRVIQNGVHDMLGTGPDRHLGTGPLVVVFGVPLRNSYGLAPFWWWMQYLVLRLAPHGEPLIYRALPVSLGIVGIAIFFRVSRHVIGDRTAVLITLILSTADLHVFVTSKAQFTEALLFIAMTVVATAYLTISAHRRPRWPGAVAASVAMSTYLGKGVLIALVYLMSGLAQWASGRSLRQARHIFASLYSKFRVLALAMLPLAAWWLGAEWFFANNPVRVHDLGYRGHLWEAVYDLTIGYGPHLTNYVRGARLNSLLLFTHSDAWPTLTFFAPFVAGGVALTSLGGIRWREIHGPSAFVLISISIGFVAMLGRGATEPRFAVLLLPAALFSIGFVIEWLLIAAEKERRVHYVIGAFAFASTGIYTFFMFGWQRWPDQWIWPGMPGVMVLSFALAFAAVYAFVPVLQIRRAAVVGLVLMGVVLSLVRGPLQWGVFAYAEPGPTNPNLHDVEVMYHPVQYYPPDQMDVETNAKFGDSIALLGFDTYREESMLTLVLHYRVDQIVSTPYHVFVHVWDPESGSLRGGRDTVLLNRQALTTNFWKSGEHVSQEIAIDLSNIPSGKYVVGTGLYDLATSVRLAVVDEHGAAIPDGWLPIIEGLSVP